MSKVITLCPTNDLVWASVVGPWLSADSGSCTYYMYYMWNNYHFKAAILCKEQISGKGIYLIKARDYRFAYIGCNIMHSFEWSNWMNGLIWIIKKSSIRRNLWVIRSNLRTIRKLGDLRSCGECLISLTYRPECLSFVYNCIKSICKMQIEFGKAGC